MSSDTPCRREWLAFFAILAAMLAALALRLPAAVDEARALAAEMEFDGNATAACGRTLPGSGELAAVLFALEAIQGRDAGLACPAPGQRRPYLRFAAS